MSGLATDAAAVDLDHTIEPPIQWPERGEIVSGGTILAGSDSAQAPIVSGVSILGGDSGEGIPFEMPDPVSGDHTDQASCATS